jgi:hypothetical protein
MHNNFLHKFTSFMAMQRVYLNADDAGFCTFNPIASVGLRPHLFPLHPQPYYRDSSKSVYWPCVRTSDHEIKVCLFFVSLFVYFHLRRGVRWVRSVRPL